MTFLKVAGPMTAGLLIAAVLGATAQALPNGQTTKRVYINTHGYGTTPNSAYRPRRMTEITGDGTAYLTNIDWHGWNGSVATATARVHTNDCIPYCAVGRFTSHSTRLRAWRVRTCPATGKRVYTRMTIRGIHIGGQSVMNLYHDCEPSTAADYSE